MKGALYVLCLCWFLLGCTENDLVTDPEEIGVATDATPEEKDVVESTDLKETDIEGDAYTGEVVPISYPTCGDCDDENACTVGWCSDPKQNLCSYEPVYCDDENEETDDWCHQIDGCIYWSQTCVQDVHYELWTDMVSGPKIKDTILDVSLGCCNSDLDCKGSPWGEYCVEWKPPMVGFGLKPEEDDNQYAWLCHECEDNCDCPFGQECVLAMQNLLTQEELDCYHEELEQDFLGAPRRPVLRCQDPGG
ncbi:MAG: hypothetical protein HOA57_04845 [Candidatus Magasanikbacteria bacterium]|jgi:hypothetical protein|nr:hypothetical protein [Candidatus Magasanikbacteria bacterium]MBT4315318.1 hypothetical protein [Candidatus Magasanikbacteria bacterium]MBT4547190.1 hypothetical protein [Candidatus Magasanikbacteria bacterium]MBT6819670.1 hypothetical protein [Candidatus Magasanikbacteria bacterium]